MPASPNEILLVTPVWNDSARLAGFGKTLAASLAASPLPIRWIIADDGSAEGEHARLTDLKNEFCRIFPGVELHLAAAHHGKGSVVREAWALAPDAAWLAFADADGSITAEDMLGLISSAYCSGKSVLGIRKRTATTRIVETPWRALAHRLFLLAVHLLLGLRCADAQCGAKVLKGGDYRAIASRLVENGLAFDSELLYSLSRNGAAWREVPVTWTEKDGGKVRPLRDGWGMLAALVRIRRRG